MQTQRTYLKNNVSKEAYGSCFLGFSCLSALHNIVIDQEDQDSLPAAHEARKLDVYRIGARGVRCDKLTRTCMSSRAASFDMSNSLGHLDLTMVLGAAQCLSAC